MRSRPPVALVSPPVARLVGYALLAGIGSLQWVRYVEGASSQRAIAWVVAGVVTGALVLAATRLSGRWATPGLVVAPLAGAFAAVAASGLDLSYLEPNHWDELGNGVARGAEALSTVRLPYLGQEPWVLTTVQLTGASICWGAAVLAAWPRGGGGVRLGGLALLLVLAASPIVSIGADRPALLGLALAVITAAFLWLERLARRPGLGLAVLAVATALIAVPLGSAADREEPWFDYKAFSERLSGGAPVAYRWDHDYGPIDWPRDGVELFRVKSDLPFYWKAQTLNHFDGRAWTAAVRADPGGATARDALPRGRAHPEWDERFSVALRRLKTSDVIGAGTILAVTAPTQPVQEDVVPGQWTTLGTRDLSNGDSYTVQTYVPRPKPEQLAAATVGRDERRAGSMSLQLDLRPGGAAAAPLTPPYPGRPQVPMEEAEVVFAPYETGRKPVAEYAVVGLTGSGARALRGSYYDRTWAFSQALRAQSSSPYDYLLRVNAYLRGPDFKYTEVPPPSGREAPLESFLLDTKRGYCQQFSGAMALLLRMGGIPARVATGFSPGGLRSSSGEWVVRDTDAHSWVEAWFDGLGWVTFDPTPAQTPARSQVAAIIPSQSEDPDTSGFQDSTTAPRRNRDPLGARREPVVSSGGAGGGGDGGSAWPWMGLGAGLVLLTVLAALVVRARRAAVETAEGALAELERALQRSGRAAPAGTTLAELERRLGTSSDGYLGALRAARYRPSAPAPSRVQRAAFRRELAAGLGWTGRLRGYWALPPIPPVPPRTLRRTSPGSSADRATAS